MIKTILAPKINTNDADVQIANWNIIERQKIKPGDPIVDLETSKAAVTIDSELSGYAFNFAKEGSVVLVGDVLCEVADSISEIDSQTTKITKNKPNQDQLNTSKRKKVSKLTFIQPTAVKETPKFKEVRFSDAALSLLTKFELDPNLFQNQGLITSKIILSYLEEYELNNYIDSRSQPLVNKKADIVRRVGPITPREDDVSIAKREEINQLYNGESGLINSSLTVTFDSLALRRMIDERGFLIKSIQPIILFEIAQLLPKWPQFTAYFENNQIHYFDRVDLGVAIDLGMGIRVVRIKNADLKTIEDIGLSTIDFSLRYMRNDLKPEELVGSTITISDLSSLNILHFQPLINGHQSAIIGIGSDSSILGHPTSIIMSFDHRISTGLEVATFLNTLKSNIVRHIDYDKNNFNGMQL